MDREQAASFVSDVWEHDIVPRLVEYIAIPNKSPAFDPDWEAHGHMDEAVALMETWCRDQSQAGMTGMTVEVVRLPGRTPLILLDVPGEGDDRVLLYGHLDKQPEMTGWRDGLGPWIPVREGERLYGRGGADDGYTVFASVTALRVLREEGVTHAPCTIVIEACEESGSYDLPYYKDALAERIGNPSLVICLDSGCGNYEQLWCTTSLRGMASGELSVEVLSEGVHSGDASGIVPSSFRLLRRLLSRLEDEDTGQIREGSFHREIPEPRRRQAAHVAQILGDAVYSKFPFAGATSPVDTDLTELVLNRTWRPALAVTGAGGMPAIADAGNVLRPGTAVKLSLRIPPTCDARAASARLKELLESEPPLGASVAFRAEAAADGWNAPPLAPWLEGATQNASRTYFGADCVHMGEGGSIPFMGMLGEQFPNAQFLITGVLGPHSNAHGPNEFLHIPTGKKVTCCVAHVLDAHHRRSEGR